MTKIRMEVEIEMFPVSKNIEAKAGDRIMVFQGVVVGVAPRNITAPVSEYVSPSGKFDIKDQILNLLESGPKHSRRLGDLMGFNIEDRTSRHRVSLAVKALAEMNLIEPISNGARRQFTWQLKQK